MAARLVDIDTVQVGDRMNDPNRTEVIAIDVREDKARRFHYANGQVSEWLSPNRVDLIPGLGNGTGCVFIHRKDA